MLPEKIPQIPQIPVIPHNNQFITKKYQDIPNIPGIPIIPVSFERETSKNSRYSGYSRNSTQCSASKHDEIPNIP